MREWTATSNNNHQQGLETAAGRSRPNDSKLPTAGPPKATKARHVSESDTGEDMRDHSRQEKQWVVFEGEGKPIKGINEDHPQNKGPTQSQR